MTPHDDVFLTPREVADLFRAKDERFAYRAAVGTGFLRSAARRFQRRLLFHKATVLKIIEAQSAEQRNGFHKR